MELNTLTESVEGNEFRNLFLTFKHTRLKYSLKRLTNSKVKTCC